jgi:ankyrin repeat protein
MFNTDVIKHEHFENVNYLECLNTNMHPPYDVLIWAIENRQLEVIKYLVSQGVDPLKKSICALRCSTEKGYIEIVKYLVSLGADPHEDKYNAFKISAQNGHLELTKYLVSLGANIHSDNEYALTMAAMYRNLEVIEYLVSQGADPRIVIKRCPRFINILKKYIK